MLYLLKRLNISKKFFTFVSTPSSSFAVNQVTSFSRKKKTLNSQNKRTKNLGFSNSILGIWAAPENSRETKLAK